MRGREYLGGEESSLSSLHVKQFFFLNSFIELNLDTLKFIHFKCTIE